MEDKELNLCEILKGHEGEEFYSLMHGNIRYMTNSAEGFMMFDYPESISLYPNGKYDDNAEVILYPSRESYLKYPLDAKKAWQEFVEANKPQYILQAQLRLLSNSGTEVENYECVEIDSEDIDLQQVAEAVRECLMKFHEQYNQQ